MARKGEYILKIGADISAVEAAVRAARGEVTSIGDDKVLIQIDYDHGDINDIRDAIQKIADYDPKVKVQVQYDLESATLRQKLKEQEEDDLFLSLFKKQKAGGNELDQYVSDICQEIYQGLDDGLSKIDLSDKLKKAIDIQRAFGAMGGELALDVQDIIYDLKEELKLDDYEGDRDYLKRFQENAEKNKTIIKGLKLQLEDLKKAGAIDTDGVIDFSGTDRAEEAIKGVNNALNQVEERATSNTKIKFFDGLSEQIYDVVEDAEKVEELLDRLANKWSNVGFRTGTSFTNEKGRVTDNLYSQLVNGMDSDTFGSGTYFGGDFAGTVKWMENSKHDRNLFAANLGSLTKMLRLESDDMAYDLEKAMAEIHAFIAHDIFPHENYQDILAEQGEFIAVNDIESLFENNRELFETLKISKETVAEFVSQQRDWLQQFKTNDGSIPDILKQEESFGSKFIKYALGVNGIDSSLLSGNIDSATLGTNIFDKALADSLERLDFGNNKEIAQKFAEKVIGNTLKRKAENPDVDLDETFRLYTGVKSKAFSSGNFAEMAENTLFSEESIKRLYAQLEEARKIQHEAIFKPFSELNTDWQNNNDLTAPFEKLINYLKNNKMTLDDFFDQMKSGSEQTKKQLEELYNGSAVNPRRIDEGEMNWGGIVGEDYTLIARSADLYKQRIADLIPLLNKARDAGANVGEIISTVIDDNKDVIYEIQRTVPGLNVNNDNLDYLQATDDQIQKLISDIKILQDVGLFVDLEGNNIMYDKNAGFSFIDLDRKKKQHTSNSEDDIINHLRKYAGDKWYGSNLQSVADPHSIEVDSLRSELDQAEKDAEAERRRAADAEERAEQAEDEAKGYLDANTRLSNELAEERKNASERERADAERISQLESDLSLKDDLYRIAVQDQVDSDKRAKEYEELNKDLQRQVSELQRGKQANESTDNLGQESSNTAGGIDNESEALTRLASIALTAAANKDLVTQSNISLASQMTASTSKILEEAEALDKLAQNAKKAADEKKRFTNNAKEAEPAEEKTKKNTENKGKNKKDYEREYLSSIDKFKKLAQDGALEQLLPDRYSSLRQQLNSIEPNAYSIDKFNDSLKETATLLSDVKKRHVEIEKASEKGYMKAISEYTNSEQDLLKYLPDSAEQLKKELNSIEPNTASIDQFMSHLEEARAKMDGMRQSFDMWRYSFDEANILNNKIQNNSHLNELFGQRMSDIEDKTPYIDPYDTEGVEKYHDEVKSLAIDLQRVKDTAAENVNSGISAIDQLAKDRNQYINALVKTADGKGTDALKDIIQNYNSELDGIRQRIADIKAEWGEDDHNANRFQKYFDLYQSDTAEKTRIRLLADAQAKQQKITNAQTSSTDFVPTFTAELKSAHDSVDSIVKEISGADVSKFFDEEAVEKWVDSLKKAQNTIDNIKNQKNVSATEGQLQTLMRRINTDMSHRGLRGTLADEYSDLKSRVEAAAAAIRDADDAAEAVSKIDMQGLVTEWSTLNAKAREAGQLSDGFAKKFSEAINNQSAQFLATYFSFQDMVRYAKEISQTVVQTDSALVELRKVSNESNDRIQESFQKSAETAQEMGSTVTDVVNSTADWSRLGYDIGDAEELARVTTLFQKVGDNMTQESASQSLVSMLQGFQMDASQAERIVDSVNAVANNFAIDTAGIGDALQRSAAAFNAAGTDLNKSIALVTTANAVVQDPSSVGTMFKTMSARIRGQCRPIYSEGYSPQCVINAA